ncbi:protein-disulfide reductase DsbD domain-containing protein [Devosia nitrariae]
MRPLLLSALIVLSSVAASWAGETAWQEVAPEVSIRLVSTGEVAADGRTLIGLEIDMPETTKTYWRIPGETGIPTELDVSGSEGVRAHRVLWPYPTVETRDGYVDYVYYGPLVLPVELTVEGSTAQLELKALLGICSDICVPVTAAFSLSLAGERDTGNALRLRQAFALTPAAWTDADSPLGEVRYDGEAKALSVELKGKELNPTSLIGAFADGTPLLGPAEPDPSGTRAVLPVLDKVDARTLAGRPLELVFRTDLGAFSIDSTVAAD